MKVLRLLDHGGRQLTQPEIDLASMIGKHREQLRAELADRLQQRQLLSNSTKVAAERAESIRLESIRAAYEAANEAHQASQATTAAAPEQAQSSSTASRPKKPKALPRPSSPDESADALDTSIEESASSDLLLPPPAALLAAGASSHSRPIKKRQRVDDDSAADDHYLTDSRPKPFSPETGSLLLDAVWDSREVSDNLVLSLSGYDFSSGPNTLAISFSVDLSSRGWAFNLTPATDEFFTDVLLHFNPRYKKQQLLVNDRQGTWGTDVKTRMTSSDSLYASHVHLVIQIRPQGFLLFANDKFTTFFAHRRPFFTGVEREKELKLAFLTADGNDNPQQVVVDKVWWGHLDLEHDILSPSVRQVIEAAVAEPVASVMNPLPPRTVVISNLPRYEDLETLQGLEYALFDLFEAFHPEAISMVRGQGRAYCRLPTAENVADAIEALNGSEMGTPDGDCTLALTSMMAATDSSSLAAQQDSL